MRDSYVNAWLIQSRGARASVPCTKCQQQMDLDPDSYAKPFPYCIRLPGHFGGCCGNCKWPDAAIRCSVRDGVGQAVANPAVGLAPVARPVLPAPGDDAANPIDVDTDEEEGGPDNPIVL